MLVEGKFTIEKTPSKAVWHCVLFTDLKTNNHSPFGWLNVYGFVDDFELNNYNLQPFGNGQLFLLINAKIRQLIKKKGRKSISNYIKPK